MQKYAPKAAIELYKRKVNWLLGPDCAVFIVMKFYKKRQKFHLRYKKANHSGRYILRNKIQVSFLLFVKLTWQN
ncbi:hypothetical protein BAX94_16305 [Elizabethkingia meningoseptica]|uniref:Uncharacterized protein n=1 Tax=Elizabethkingia meningoseptica TaxID=238 RepID=A0A1V3U1P8_ELIME|nr:hypothetical protein BBD35_07440 [Elizabethkingia meningoseptica]ODM53030.1 hypothetical protein BES09_09320 [Elizabethkingia meningoseptica]OHT27910.1 hypothetical protein BGC12_14770 [Elizabethkingia meningoseptica]OHT27933.1 hypothetical protein BFF93_09325 [Elizabethkingia meningoseptica]OOH95453.1 hypothetical protein BMF97_08805 [Elizabethkingia meningoseptica]